MVPPLQEEEEEDKTRMMEEEEFRYVVHRDMYGWLQMFNIVE